MSAAVRAVASGRTPEALKGLAKASFFLNEGEAAIDARECAYVAYRHAGGAVDAARVAIALAWDYRPGTDDDSGAWVSWSLDARSADLPRAPPRRVRCQHLRAGRATVADALGRLGE
jgi:hypothetical protein